MLPSGWNTYVGTALKILAALTALLNWLSTGQPPDMQDITGIFGLYAAGSAITSSGQALQSTLLRNTDLTAVSAAASGVPVSVVANPPAAPVSRSPDATGLG